MLNKLVPTFIVLIPSLLTTDHFPSAKMTAAVKKFHYSCLIQLGSAGQESDYYSHYYSHLNSISPQQPRAANYLTIAAASTR